VFDRVRGARAEGDRLPAPGPAGVVARPGLPACRPHVVAARAIGPSEVLALQRLAGNLAVVAALQRSGPGSGGGCGCGCGGAGGCRSGAETDDEAAGRVPAPTVQRTKENEAPLAGIQGLPMHALLPAIANLDPPAARTDFDAAAFVGGPRLVIAMRAVQAKAAGTSWLDFAVAQSSALAAFPNELYAIIPLLGGPMNARAYPKDRFGGRYDAIVDPAGGTITIVLRVALSVQPDRSFDPGDPAHNDPASWRNRAPALLAQYRAQMAGEVQSVLSGKGSITAACPKGRHTTFKTAMRLEVVDDANAAHRVVVLHSRDAEGRGGATHSEDPSVPINLKEGTLGVKKHTVTKSNPKGTAPVTKEVESSTTAHEVGHAIGLEHPVCKGGDDKCYGITMDQYEDVMGGGAKMQVLKPGAGGAPAHDDFAPWEAVAKVWAAAEMLPGALDAACNTWTPS